MQPLAYSLLPLSGIRALFAELLSKPSAEVCMTEGAAAAPTSVEISTIRKVRFRILPFVFILYVVSFIDRINIGFAALTMNRELGIGSEQFGLLAGIFFFGYFLFEVPSNLLLHKLGARVWLSRIIITWGALAALTGLVRSVPQLYLLRFLLGLAEAGYFPGIVLYLTYWFRQREQAQAIALFLTGLPATSILGAPISGVILDHVHWFGLSSWRWLLILQAAPAILCGVLTLLVLPSNPAEATFLAEEERTWLAGELSREQRAKEASQHISAGQALANVRVWHIACVGILLNTAMYTLSFWLPQVVKAMAATESNTKIGLFVTLPYLVGLVAMVFVSRSSDRHLERRYHAAVPAIVAGAALVGVNAAHSVPAVLVLLCLAAMGIYSVYGPLYSLPSEFLTGFAAASGIALISSIANLGGFIGPYLVGWISHRTGSLHSGLALTGVSVFLSACLMLLLPRRAGALSPLESNTSFVGVTQVGRAICQVHGKDETPDSNATGQDY
jgi:MFS transporter, ACS family, tartrate transporter